VPAQCHRLPQQRGAEPPGGLGWHGRGEEHPPERFVPRSLASPNFRQTAAIVPVVAPGSGPREICLRGLTSPRDMP
jgi:hypothetical protein